MGSVVNHAGIPRKGEQIAPVTAPKSNPSVLAGSRLAIPGINVEV